MRQKLVYVVGMRRRVFKFQGVDIQYNYMEKKHTVDQQPYNPFMFPYPFPFAPPPFMNPMMGMPPKCPSGKESEPLYPPPGMQLPPFPFPPFPMMYPPPPQAFFRFHQMKPPGKELKGEPKSKKMGDQEWEAPKKVKVVGKELEKKESCVIVLSDDDQEMGFIEPSFTKKNVDNKIKAATESNIETKVRRTERKYYPPEKLELTLKRTRKIQKKKQFKFYFKEKQELKNLDLKEVKFTPQTSTETPHEHYNRSSRIKYLTIKQGKGKIMIGEEFQAKLAPFLAKNESYTIWVGDKKANLLGRFLKEKP